MPKPPPTGRGLPADVPPDDETLTTGFYDVSPETRAEPPKKKPGLETMIDDALGDDADSKWSDAASTRVAEPDLDDERPPPGRGPWRKVLAVVAVAAVAGGAGLVYRSHHRQEVLQQGLARARELMLPDTYAGYRDAARILLPLAEIDPLEAGSMRAFALAMLHADYRDQKAGAEAEALLVAPDRAPVVPPVANLAHAMLALARREAGTASTHAARPGGAVWGATIQGRLALLAGNPSGALESLDQAVALEPSFPAALALRGDALRRLKRFEAAREAYTSALRASPDHARAAFGMAKLALGGQARAEEALPALERLAADQAGTPSNERGRAALHLAALRARQGDRAGSAAAIHAAGVEGANLAWLEKAVTEEELSRTGYRPVGGAPAALQSASDDDPHVPAEAAAPRKEAKADKKAAKASKKTASRKAISKKTARKKAATSKKATSKKVKTSSATR